MKTLKLFASFMIMALFAITSCEGPQGIPGPPGNANVQSQTVETISSDWDWDAEACNWYLDLQWDAIDFDMVDYGAVLVYMENPTDFYGWHQLPLTLYANEQYSSTIETVYYDDGLTIFWTNSDLQQHQNPCEFYNANLTFKVVLIDAAMYSKHKDIDFSNYEIVKDVFKLAD